MTHLAYICASQDGCGFVAIAQAYETCPTCKGPMVESSPMDQFELSNAVTKSVKKLKAWLNRKKLS